MTGFSLHDELELLVGTGLTPMEALQAATLNPGRDFAIDAGTIEKGKNADLVILDANPLADIRNARAIFAVIAGGQLFDRKALVAMLAGVERAAR
jgi:imidazolonepropionase-like amidohydrolase